jgi:hypothetical protein
VAPNQLSRWRDGLSDSFAAIGVGVGGKAPFASEYAPQQSASPREHPSCLSLLVPGIGGFKKKR